MKFCPLLSNTEKKFPCREDCAWYYKQAENDSTCEINFLTEKLNDTAHFLETIAKISHYNSH